MDPRDIHYAQTMEHPAPDPSWLDEDPDGFVQDPRFTQWEQHPEQVWEEFSLEHLPAAFTPAPQAAPVFVATGPVDDTFEQMVLVSFVGVVVAAGMCAACATLGFALGLVVAA